MDNNDLNKTLVDALLRDKRRERFWRMFRFFVIIIIVIAYFAFLTSSTSKKDHSANFSGKPYVSLVRMNGIIMPGQGFSARVLVPRLEKAFKDKKAKGVILLINSPGGSPVQASIIHDKIEQLKAKYKKKVVVVAEDSLASGAYLVATAADDIYVNADTITGSIGVIMNGFGFVDTIKKLGVTRRVYTAGVNKDRLDPFLPETKNDLAKVRQVLNVVHQHFIDDVKQGRKGKLANNPDLFTGDFWTGDEAVKLGLADGTGDLWTVMKKVFKVSKYRDYSKQPSFFDRVLKGAEAQTLTSLGLQARNNTPVQEIAQY